MDVYKEWEELKTRPMPCLAQKCFQKQSWGRHDPDPCAYTCCFCNFSYNTWNSLLCMALNRTLHCGCGHRLSVAVVHHLPAQQTAAVIKKNYHWTQLSNFGYVLQCSVHHLHCASTMTTVCVSKADNRKIEVKIRAVKMQAICRLKCCCKSSSTFRIEHS